MSGTLHCCLQTHVPSIPIHVSIRFHLSIPFLHFLSNVGKTIINHPFGNGLHNLFMVILGVVYYWFNHIIGLPAVDSTAQVQPHTTLRNMGDKLPGHCRRFSGMCWRGFFYDARRLGFLGDVKRCVPLNIPMYIYIYKEREREVERGRIYVVYNMHINIIMWYVIYTHIYIHILYSVYMWYEKIWWNAPNGLSFVGVLSIWQF